ncbi:MAG: hypothetical protein ABI600_12835 [Luteolibacter sp.]
MLSRCSAEVERVMVETAKIGSVLKADVLGVSATELQVSMSGPATLVNRFFIGLNPNGVRIAFAEQSGEMPIFRTAIVMGFPEAFALSSVLKDLLEANVKVQPAPTK